MNLENPEDCYHWDISKLWDVYLNLYEEHQETLYNEYLKLMEGITLPIPIWYLTQQWYTVNPGNKNVHVDGHDKYDIKEFMKEKEKRETIMRKTILDMSGEDESTTPR